MGGRRREEWESEKKKRVIDRLMAYYEKYVELVSRLPRVTRKAGDE